MITLELPQKTFVPEKIKTALQDLLKDPKYGFLNVLSENYPWEEFNSYVSALEDFEQIAIMGIGGSSQGTKSFVHALNPEFIDKKFVYFDRIDESYLDRQLAKIQDLEKTVWFVVSKSGSTTETLFTLNTLLNKTEGDLLEYRKNLFIVTENKDSVLGKWAQKLELEIIPAASDIEGRFSLFSFNGLIPLALVLNDFDMLKSGAKWMADNMNVVESLSAFYAESFSKERWISNVWLYTEKLKEFGFWLEQLWAESLGKYKDAGRRISTPFCCLGTNDQHSLLQQMEEGYPDKSQLFVQLKPTKNTNYDKNWLGEGTAYLDSYNLDEIMNKYCRATYESLDEHPRALLTLENCTEGPVFALHLLIALTIGTLGKYKGIEIYEQPGVEKSKQLFRDLL